MKYYEVQINIGKKEWIPVEKYVKQSDALHYVGQNGGGKFPLRVMRVIKTVVFEGDK